MFSVFSKSGRIFSGSMEDLARVAPIAALARSSRAVAGAGVMALAQRRNTALSARSAPVSLASGDQDLAHRTAVAAYANTVKDDATRHPLSTVADIMSTGVVTLLDTTLLGEAWATLARERLGQAPVVNQRGLLVGLLTRAELMREDRLPGPQTHALVWKAMLLQPVSELMVTPIPSVDPTTDIRRLARVLLDTGLPGLPVSDAQGQVTGFVSRTDILHAVVADPPLDLWS